MAGSETCWVLQARGGLTYKLGADYTVVFKLDYEEYFLNGVVSTPKAWKVVDIRIFKHKEMPKSMPEEEGINLYERKSCYLLIETLF